MAPTKQEILAASAGWVAVTLNVLPGLGAGYLYQRRWKAYWITSALATTWFVLGAVLGQDAGAAEELQNQLVGLGGLVALAAGTAVEAGLAAKKARLVDKAASCPASHTARGMGAAASLLLRKRASEISVKSECEVRFSLPWQVRFVSIDGEEAKGANGWRLHSLLGIDPDGRGHCSHGCCRWCSVVDLSIGSKSEL